MTSMPIVRRGRAIGRRRSFRVRGRSQYKYAPLSCRISAELLNVAFRIHLKCFGTVIISGPPLRPSPQRPGVESSTLPRGVRLPAPLDLRNRRRPPDAGFVPCGRVGDEDCTLRAVGRSWQQRLVHHQDAGQLTRARPGPRLQGVTRRACRRFPLSAFCSRVHKAAFEVALHLRLVLQRMPTAREGPACRAILFV